MLTGVSPTADQLANLSRMTSLLSNRKGQILAHSLWKFFNFQLYCTIRDNDGEPSTHRIELPDEVGGTAGEQLRIMISLCRSERQEEALVHELLHANLIPLGYPKFRIWEAPDSEKWPLAEGITNLADHLVMLPIYLSFGYAEERFLGPCRPLSDREKHVAVDLERVASELSTPAGYLAEVSAYLRSRGINFEVVHLAGTIVRSPPLSLA